MNGASECIGTTNRRIFIPLFAAPMAQAVRG